MQKIKLYPTHLNKTSTQEVNVMNAYLPLSKNELNIQWKFSLHFGITILFMFLLLTFKKVIMVLFGIIIFLIKRFLY